MSAGRRLLTQGLLETARQDRPSAAQRSRIWEQLAVAPELAIAAPLAAEAARSVSLAPAKVAVAGASAGKLLVVGAALGSVVTVGLGVLLLRGPLRQPAPAAHPATVSVAAHAARAALHGEVGPLPRVAPSQVTEIDDLPLDPVAAGAAESARSVETAHVARRSARPKVETESDVLMREAAIVGQARTALVLGNPTAALALLDGAGRSGSRSLEPEELALRARALRLLGRDAEAAQVEDTLKARFPESFLAH